MWRTAERVLMEGDNVQRGEEAERVERRSVSRQLPPLLLGGGGGGERRRLRWLHAVADRAQKWRVTET